MKIRILGCESLGVRGLCTEVILKNRRILIDPGIALGYTRHRLHPHPFQVAVGNSIRNKIIKAFFQADDIIFSHYHGDHCPLLHANPFQLSIDSIFPYFRKKRIWAKNSVSLSKTMLKRKLDLEMAYGAEFPDIQGEQINQLRFSMGVPHGNHPAKLMMTRIEENGIRFVHASDIQLLHTSTIRKILEWKPTIMLSSGPALYLNRLTQTQITTAKENAILLTKNIKTVILDHHICRSTKGLKFIHEIDNLNTHQVLCGADYMKHKVMLLEAWRKNNYQEQPIPENWHENYKSGLVSFDDYLKWRDFSVNLKWKK